jgi:hypothetical protein
MDHTEAQISSVVTRPGVFADSTWRRPIDDSVLERVDIDVPDADEDVKSLVGVPPAGNSGRRSRPASSAWPGRTA